jgi:hypothetical protein
LSTHYGPLTYTMRSGPKGISLMIDGGVRIPPGGIIIKPPVGAPTKVLRVPARVTIPPTQ